MKVDTHTKVDLENGSPARDHKISYNGAKNYRDKVNLFGVKFIVDNG